MQIEVDVAFDKLISHPTNGEYGKLGPIRMLSFGMIHAVSICMHAYVSCGSFYVLSSGCHCVFVCF